MVTRTKLIGNNTLRALRINPRRAKRFAKAARAVGKNVTKPRSHKGTKKGVRLSKNINNELFGNRRK